MTNKRRRVMWSALLICALGLSAISFAAAGRLRRPKGNGAKLATGQNPPGLANAKAEDYVRAARLSPQLRWNLKALGDRLEKPGRERLTLTGTLSRTADTAPVPVLLILEFPDRLRLTVQDGIQQRIITFDGRQAGSVGSALTSRERDFIETLVYDTAEHFLLSQTKGAATRVLGQRFRADDGTTPNYTGPYYDLYEVSDQSNSATDARVQSKTFYFDSSSLLLQKARYQILRNGAPVEVETRISNWQQTQGQQIPRRIVRLENDQAVMALTITGLAIAPRVNDGSFGQQ